MIFQVKQWPWIDKSIWDQVREEAEDLAKYDQPLDITGFDIDPRMIQVAQENAAEAGFVDLINLEQQDVRDLTFEGLNGVMVGNPPYGERIGEIEEAEEITRDLGHIMKESSFLVCLYVSSLENFEKLYGKRATKKTKII